MLGRTPCTSRTACRESLARAHVSASSNGRRSGRTRLIIGGSELRCLPMTTAGLECWNSCSPVKQVIRGRRQRVLIGPAVDVEAHQLLGCRIRGSADSHVGGGEGSAGGVGEVARNTEVSQQDSSFTMIDIGDEDVGGLDVAVQEIHAVCVVERSGCRLDDVEHDVGRQSRPGASAEGDRRRYRRRSPSKSTVDPGTCRGRGCRRCAGATVSTRGRLPG